MVNFTSHSLSNDINHICFKGNIPLEKDNSISIPLTKQQSNSSTFQSSPDFQRPKNTIPPVPGAQSKQNINIQRSNLTIPNKPIPLPQPSAQVPQSLKYSTKISPTGLPKTPNSQIQSQNIPQRPISAPSLEDFIPIHSSTPQAKKENLDSMFTKKPLPPAPSQLSFSNSDVTSIQSNQTQELLVVSRYIFEGNTKDDLLLKEGDVIHKIEKFSEHWWNGTNFRTKQRGKFPVGHVKVSI